jgi:hypothetical protein
MDITFGEEHSYFEFIRDCEGDKEVYCNNIYNKINDFILKIQEIFSIEEIEKILYNLLFANSSQKINDLDISLHDFNTDDFIEEPTFNHKFNKIKLNIIAQYDIEGPILFYQK